MIRQGNSGVTQLELLVSLALMGMITVLLANALNFNRQSLDRARFLSNETEMALASFAFRNWIESIPLNYSGGTALEIFEGDTQGMRFRSLVTDGSFRVGAATEFILEVFENGENRSLVVSGSGLHPLREEERKVTRTLEDSLSRLKISYYGRRSSDSKPQWHGIWSDSTYLPDLVKIEWESEDGTPAPPLTVQPGKIERQSTMSLSSLLPPG